MKPRYRYLNFVNIAGWLLLFSLVTLTGQSLPTAESTIFSGSGNCVMCHEPGFPNPQALTGPSGEDVSPVTLWRSTMMANSARDPFWQARISAEVADHPQLQTVIEDLCLTCHTPMGRTEAIANGQPHFTFAEAMQDSLSMDGVSCTACHQIQPDNFGADSSFSGNYIIRNDRVIYGPYDNQHEQPMVSYVHYLPTYGPHMRQSELCATCHTLIVPYVDDSGQVAGYAPEQTPYLEWKNSVYPAMSIECQSCHVPELDYAVQISNRPIWLPSYNPYYRHYFVGGNVFMLTMLKNHGSEIGVTATPTQFDSTIARTMRQLREKTAVLSADAHWYSADTLELKVAIHNLAGHKFPTAYPSRRAWIYLQLNDQLSRPWFTSGAWDAPTSEIVGLDQPFEPHYDVITDDQQVQVYEVIAHDVNNQVTYSLLRNAGHIKDNRLPPEGFTTLGIHYDSTRIAGAALSDPNFNRDGSSEGTAIDTITYRIGGLDARQPYTADVRILYQSVAHRNVTDLTRFNTPQIQRFMGYYNQADKSPIVVDSLLLPVTPTGIAAPGDPVVQSPLLVSAYPNPFNPQVRVEVQVANRGRLEVRLYNLLGEVVATLFEGDVAAGSHRYDWQASQARGRMSSGVFLLRARFQSMMDGQRSAVTRKLMYLK